MRTCIYYEQDSISADEARRCRALAGTFVGEAVPADAAWSEEIPGSAPEREPDFRSLRYLDVLMPWLIRLDAALEATASGAAWRYNASLPEIGRYELLFGVAAAEQRWQALSNIRRRWNPDRLLWCTSRPGPDRELAALGRAVTGMQFEVHRTSSTNRAPWKSAWQSLKGMAAEPVKRSASMARAALHQPRWPAAGAEVVFTEYFPNSVSSSLPIAEHLAAEHGVRVRWLAGRKKVADALAARGVESLVLPEVLSARTHWRGRLNANQRGVVRGALRTLPEELFAGTGAPGGREYLLPVLESRIVAVWDHAAYWIEAYREAFAALRPAVVLSTTYSSATGRAAALAARQFGARAVYLQHGLFPDYRVFSSFCHDTLLLWGECNARSLTNFGIEPRRIRVTGATIYDKLQQRAPGDSRFPRAGEPLEVAFMASRTGGMMVSHAKAKNCLLAVARAASQVPGARLTVKIHPGDATSLVNEVMQEFPDFRVIRSGSSQDVIMQSDLVIVASSTTGLEACAAGKPLFVLDVIDDPNAVPYVGYGAALNVAIPDTDPAADLKQAIHGLQEDPSLLASLAEGRRRLVEDMLNGSAGNAAEQAAGAVLECLGRRARELAPKVAGE